MLFFIFQSEFMVWHKRPREERGGAESFWPAVMILGGVGVLVGMSVLSK